MCLNHCWDVCVCGYCPVDRYGNRIKEGRVVAIRNPSIVTIVRGEEGGLWVHTPDGKRKLDSFQGADLDTLPYAPEAYGLVP